MLSDDFWVAGMVRWVKHIFVSILDRMSLSYTRSGVRLKQVVRYDSFLVWRGRPACLPGPPGPGARADTRANCSCKGLSGLSPVPKPRQGVIKIIEDNRPLFRCFCLPPGWGRLLFPGPEMAEDAFYHGRLVNQADDFHLVAAAGTSQGVHLVDFFYQVPPVTPWA